MYQMEFNDVKCIINEVRTNFKFTKNQTEQPKFGYFQTSKDKESLDKVYEYVKGRVEDMLSSDYVSGTEFLDLYSCWKDNFTDTCELLILMRQLYKEKEFIDDFIEVYECFDEYILCPDRYTIRRQLDTMRFENDYSKAYLHALVKYEFITKEELFEFLPKAHEMFD